MPTDKTHLEKTEKDVDIEIQKSVDTAWRIKGIPQWGPQYTIIVWFLDQF